MLHQLPQCFTSYHNASPVSTMLHMPTMLHQLPQCFTCYHNASPVTIMLHMLPQCFTSYHNASHVTKISTCCHNNVSNVLCFILLSLLLCFTCHHDVSCVIISYAIIMLHVLPQCFIYYHNASRVTTILHMLPQCFTCCHYASHVATMLHMLQ